MSEIFSYLLTYLEKFVQLFGEFSKSWELEELHLLLLEEFLCNLYGHKCQNINLIRYKMFQKRVTQNKRAPTFLFYLHADQFFSYMQEELFLSLICGDLI